jgi:hypothetical protein
LALYDFCIEIYVLIYNFIFKANLISVILMENLLNEVFAGLQEAYSRYGLSRLKRYEDELILKFGESYREDVEEVLIIISEQIQGMRRRCDGGDFMRFFTSLRDLNVLEERVREVVSTSLQQAA